jgi:hypothetical protein
MSVVIAIRIPTHKTAKKTQVHHHEEYIYSSTTTTEALATEFQRYVCNNML